MAACRLASIVLVTLLRTVCALTFSASNQTIFADGMPLLLKGVSWYGLESPHGALGGLDKRRLEDLIDFVAGHGFNALRIPLSAHHIHSNELPSDWAISPSWNPELRGKHYLELIDALVDEATRRGLLLLFDMHLLNSSAPDGTVSKLWYDAATPEDAVAEAWRILARRYCARSEHIIGAELFNEPHAASWGLDSPGSALTDWSLGAARLGEALLETCPRWLLFVTGVGESSLACQPACQPAVVDGAPPDVAACLAQGVDFMCKAAPDQTSENHFWG